MRYGAEHREKTHESLVDAAAALVRRDGPEKISVAELMKSVGLTHGGFYYHFSSREDMIARAIERAFSSTVARLETIAAKETPAVAIREYVERYLSPAHRDHRSTGCPLPTLTAQIAQLGDDARQAFEQGAARLTSTLATMLEQAGRVDSGALAISMLAEMSGALSISRVIADPARSDELLRICRETVLERVLPD